MNQSQAKEWLPLIQALAEGKTIQFQTKSVGWIDMTKLQLDFDTLARVDVNYYRIKPEPKKSSYRIALFKNRDYLETGDDEYYPLFCNDSADKHIDFVRWLTDRIEYELPEGEA